MSWNPKSLQKPLTMTEFMAMAEKKYPGISRNPLVREALKRPGLKEAIADLPPVRARSNARIKGYQAPLSDAQHIAVLKQGTGVRTRQTRQNTRRKTTLSRVNLRKIRRNLSADPKELLGLLANIYKTNDLVTIAVREMVQNARDAIASAQKQGAIRKGRIDVTLDRDTRRLSVADNGMGMTPEILCTFTNLGGSTKGRSGEKRPAMQLTIRGFTRPKMPGKLPQGGAYYVRINGLYQFTRLKQNSDRLLPADYVLDYVAPGGVGGFGIAKAVIFAASTDEPVPSWEVHTQDNYYDSQMDHDGGSDQCTVGKAAPVRKVAYRQGTEITIKNINAEYFDQGPVIASAWGSGTEIGGTEPIEQRLKLMLSFNTLPDIDIYFNGERIKETFASNRGYAVPRVGPWTDYCNPKGHDGWPPGTEGLLGGSSNPKDKEYPIGSGRDTFQAKGDSGFNRFARGVEFDPKDTEREDNDPIVFDPARPETGTDESKVAEALEATMMQPNMAKYLLSSYSAASGVSAAMEVAFASGRAARAQNEKIKKSEWAEKGGQVISKAPGQGMEGTEVLSFVMQPGAQADMQLVSAMEAAAAPTTRNSFSSLVYALRTTLVQWDQGARAAGSNGLDEYSGYLSQWFDRLTQIADYGLHDEEDVRLLLEIENSYTEQATESGGAGIGSAVLMGEYVKKILKESGVDKETIRYAAQNVGKFNPFGGAAGLYVSRTNLTKIKRVQARNQDGTLMKDDSGKVVMTEKPVFDEARYNRFLRSYKKYIPTLILWDATARLIANGMNIMERFYTGFVLDDSVHALYVTPGGSYSKMVLLNPLAFNALLPGFDTAADAAHYLHASCAHEIAHMLRQKGHHAGGHDEEFSIIREDIGFKTSAVLPVITALVAQHTKLRNPYGKESVAKAKARYQNVAESVTCPSCLKQAVVALEQDGNLDTVQWIRERMDWTSGDPQ